MTIRGWLLVAIFGILFIAFLNVKKQFNQESISSLSNQSSDER